MVDTFRSTAFKNSRIKVTDEEHAANVSNFMRGFTGDAKTRAQNLVDKLELAYAKPFVYVKDIYDEEEQQQLKRVKDFESQVSSEGNAYRWGKYLLPIKLFESSVFLYRHGLQNLKHKANVGSKAIIDAGCFVCDSALIFRDEFPSAPIYGFEPLKSNYDLCLKTIELNRLNNIIVENLGLGDKIEVQKMKTFDTNLKNIESTICDDGDVEIRCTTLDDYVARNQVEVGLIKTDVEGFEQRLLAGAEKTIKAQRPTLLISIYHNYDDFYKIKPLIESWNLGYRFDVFQGVQNSGDITVETLLLAEIPEE